MITKDPKLEKLEQALKFKGRSDRTVYSYLLLVERFIDTIGSKDEYTKLDIMEFINSLGNVSNTYKAWAIAVLKRFWLDVLDEKFPLQGEGPRIEVKPQPFVSPDEIDMLLRLSEHNPRDHAMVQLFIDTGMRRSELCNLNRDSYKNGELLIKLSKGEEYRTVKLSQEADEALNKYLATRRDKNPAMFRPMRGHKRIHPDIVTQTMKKYFKLAGTDELGKGAHSYRRGVVTDLAKKGMSDLLIAKWGGWKSVAMVSRYSQLTSGDIDAKVKELKPLRG